jgi:lysozyme
MISDKGIDLIRTFEGLKLKAYLCPAGVPTIGIGTTVYPDGRKVRLGDTITQAQAVDYLRHDLEWCYACVSKTTPTTTQPQFDALCSLTYNIGCGGFAKSTVAREHRAGNYEQAADAFLLWNKAAGRVLPGLVSRREAEREIYRSGLPSAAVEMARCLIAKSVVQEWQRSNALTPDGIIGPASWRVITGGKG